VQATKYINCIETPLSYFSTLKTFSILLSVLLLQACTTLVANEKMHSSVKAPASTVRITVTETAIRGRLSAYLSAGSNISKGTPTQIKLNAQAQRDVPKMLQLAKTGVSTSLTPLLQKRGIQVLGESESLPSNGNINIITKSYAVECGQGTVICQTSVLFEVWFVDNVHGGPVWSADFKVGAPMGGEQNEQVFENFYSSVMDKLTSLKLIK
jgi:hypothetical protein